MASRFRECVAREEASRSARRTASGFDAKAEPAGALPLLVELLSAAGRTDGACVGSLSSAICANYALPARDTSRWGIHHCRRTRLMTCPPRNLALDELLRHLAVEVLLALRRHIKHVVDRAAEIFDP